jgi:hypothetical protein
MDTMGNDISSFLSLFCIVQEEIPKENGWNLVFLGGEIMYFWRYFYLSPSNREVHQRPLQPGEAPEEDLGDR